MWVCSQVFNCEARLCVSEAQRVRLCVSEAQRVRLCVSEAQRVRLCVSEVFFSTVSKYYQYLNACTCHEPLWYLPPPGLIT